MTILDTHAWIWWVAKPSRLSVRARQAIDQTEAVGVCAISCWEVAMLVAKRRLELDREVGVWIRQALAQPRCVLLPLTPEVAVESTRLVNFTGDPADRMIAATAVLERATMVTKDRRFRDLQQLKPVW